MTTPDLVYRPSPVVGAAKRVLVATEHRVPPSVYQRLYDFAFASYRRLLRALYARHALVAVMKRDREEVERTRTILRVMPFSLVGVSGLQVTYDLAAAVEREGLAGAIVECGVARGGSAALMALVSARSGRHRQFWLFDSYEGLPEATEGDFLPGTTSTGRHVRPLPKGSCLGTYEEVEDLLFQTLRLDRQDITMVKGWFQDTLPSTRERIGPIALLRLDGDWYESTRCCLDNLYDQVVPQGRIIIDDYVSCFGAQRAVDEFLAARGVTVQLDFDGRGGCYFTKP